jgi:hypothetical protein
MGSPRLQDTLGAKPWRAKGDLAAATSLTTGVTASEVLECHGSSSVRVRFKATKAGSLLVAILQNDKATQQLDPAPKTIAVLDAQEVLVELDDIIGESFILIQFTAGASTSVITYCDLYRSFNPQTEGSLGGAMIDMTVPAGAASYAPEVIYLNRDWLNAGALVPSDMAVVSELQLVGTALPATAELVVDLLKPGGDPTAGGDWILDAFSYDAIGANTPIALSRWYGVRVRAKSGGTGGTATVAVRWWN